MMMHSYALKLAYSLACLLTYLLIALPYRKTSSKFKVSLSLGRKILFLLIEALKKYASMSRNWRIRTQWGRVLSYKSPHTAPCSSAAIMFSSQAGDDDDGKGVYTVGIF